MSDSPEGLQGELLKAKQKMEEQAISLSRTPNVQTEKHDRSPLNTLECS